MSSRANGQVELLQGALDPIVLRGLAAQTAKWRRLAGLAGKLLLDVG